jgi:DUF4097 and DUF4098 domain-containing protein YvlB
VRTCDSDVVVHFTARVPPGAALPGRTVNGDVEGEALRGDAESHAVNRSVRLSTTELAVASTVNGSITASMGRADWADSASLKTVNGGVRLRLPAVLNAEIRAQTLNE